MKDSSDEREVQMQFRKLAKQVHPDKCDLQGADAAFKAICTAAAEIVSSEGALCSSVWFLLLIKQ